VIKISKWQQIYYLIVWPTEILSKEVLKQIFKMIKVMMTICLIDKRIIFLGKYLIGQLSTLVIISFKFYPFIKSI